MNIHFESDTVEQLILDTAMHLGRITAGVVCWFSPRTLVGFDFTVSVIP
jgi:hypothetical protein